MLIEREINTREVLFGSDGEKSERNLSWLDQSNVGCLSEDGGTLLFDEGGEGGGPKGSVYLRSIDGSAPVRLGDGQALDLSPDGKWALVRDFKGDHPQLLVVPTAVGEPRRFRSRVFTSGAAVFLPPDGRSIVFSATEKDSDTGDYVVDLAAAESRGNS